jgi:hypothetical protein
MNNGNQPIAPMPYTNSDGSIQHDVYSGLTKREYFAGLAMQGLLASDNLFYTDKPKIFSSLAVKYSDALLAELEAENNLNS